MGYSVVIPSRDVGNLEVCVKAAALHQDLTNITVVWDGPLSGVVESLPVKIRLGPSPFNFARNINLCIQAACSDDIIILNDDAVLVSGCLKWLVDEAVRVQGIVSAAIRGAVNNPDQQERRGGRVPRQLSTGYLAFVCVAIPRSVINHNGMGLLDERFSTYGGEDVDYCHSARVNGIPLVVHDSVVMDHGNILKSTFRRQSVPDIEPGLTILRQKWAKIQNTPLPL